MVDAAQQTKLPEPTILAFEKAWFAESPPSIGSFAADCDPAFKIRLVCELAAIDMELRWQANSQGRQIDDLLGGQPTWHAYSTYVPELGDLAQIPPELVAEEYRIRQLWGDRPGHDRFISAFSKQFLRLPRLLAEIDDELLADGATAPQADVPVSVVSAAVDPRAPLPWSDYVLQEHLGSGGFGKVYRAIQKSLDRFVAVKALHKSRQRDPQAVDQFVQEARLLARLDHRGIVGVHGLGRYPGGGYFLVLDWIDGQDLQRRLDHGSASVDEAVWITSSVAEAIHHAHQRGVIHGDLKPSNVLVDESGQVHVTDFGLGRLTPGPADSATPPSVGGGTLAYMSPEASRGEEVGGAVDVYGLGALLYALLTSQPPRQGSDEVAIWSELESGRVPIRPSFVRSEIPGHLDEIVMKCLDADPKARFPNAAGVIESLSKSCSPDIQKTPLVRLIEPGTSLGIRRSLS